MSTIKRTGKLLLMATIVLMMMLSFTSEVSCKQCQSSQPDVQTINATLMFEPEITEGYLLLGFAPATTAVLLRESSRNKQVNPTLLYAFDDNLQPVATINLTAQQPQGSTAMTGRFQSPVLYSFANNVISVDLSSQRVTATSPNSLPPLWEAFYPWMEADGSALYATLTKKSINGLSIGSGLVAVDASSLLISPVSQLQYPPGSSNPPPLFIGPCLASPSPKLSFCVVVPDAVNVSNSLVLLNTSSWQVTQQVPVEGGNFMAVSNSAQSPSTVFLYGDSGPLSNQPGTPVLTGYDQDLQPLWETPLGSGQAAGLVSNPNWANGTMLIASTLEYFDTPLQQQTFWLVDGTNGHVLSCWDSTSQLGRSSVLLLFASGTPAPLFTDPLEQLLSLVALAQVPQNGNPLLLRISTKLGN